MHLKLKSLNQMLAKIFSSSEPQKPTIVYIGAFDSISPNAAFIRLQGMLIPISKYYSDLYYTQKETIASKAIPTNPSASDRLRQIPYACIWKNVPKISFFYELARILFTAKFVFKSKTTIVLYNFSSIASIPFYLVSFFIRSRIVADLSEFYSLESLEIPWRHIYMLEFKLRFFLAANFATSCIFSSQYLRRAVHRFRLFYRTDQDYVIPTLIPPSVSNTKGQMSKRVSSPLKFLFPTQNFQRDGLNVILQAFLDLQLQYPGKFQLLILLGGSSKDKLIHFLQENKIIQYTMSSDWFKICERISRNEYIQILESSHYMIFFREHNVQALSGYPTKLSEAMEHSIAFVTNHFPHYSDFGVTDEYGYYLPTEFTSSQLRQLLIRLLEASPTEWIQKSTKIAEHNPTSSTLFEEELLRAFS